MNQSKERFTSSEIANLWTHYIRETMGLCVIKHMLNTIQDPQIYHVFQTSYGLCEKHINKLKKLFHQENFPVPKGFNEEDVNLDAPQLFTDHFCLYYIHTMAMHGSQSYSLAFTLSIRQDLRNFYYQCNIDTMDLYNQSIEVLIAKKLLDKPPYYSTPDKIHFINTLDYVTDLLGSKRSMNSIECGNIYFNIEKSLITKACLIAFKQVCKDKAIIKFLEKCLNAANKHIGTFTTLLLKEDLHLPRTYATEITNSNVAPFSEKLMLFHSGFLFAAAISYYGSAAIYSMRADIVMQCEKAIIDDLLIYSSFGKLIIKRNWMEQPPNADDRKIINN
ncbi:DUF3231 family protein [Paenibacillus sp. BSR1-1]|uniref:DUF3231 family protein n=1 Tax=Paenibacillus sp. BSR1-1 TaxID=3020845 RepID=UPI0025B1E434|nr:DUF3231 family protein [Paenibacillus sp. BSR1-1]MDN3018947.1 DUF3231 family protein [Paenibacillus sp. BSR1-1]